MTRSLRIDGSAEARSDRGGDSAARVTAAERLRGAPVRGRLFRKYILLFMGLSCAALVLSAAGDLFFAYRKEESSLGRLQREQALAVAQRIEQFFGEIRRQVGWTTYVQWDKGPLNQRRLDYLRLLHQVPAIAEVTQLDQAGREQLRVSRFAVDAVGSEIDLSHDPKFVEAQAHGIWFGPVYFRNQSEPYMTVALARAGHDGGVTAAAVNLEFIWDAIRSIQIAADGYAFVVDRRGRLIAHSDINLVLQDTSFADLPYIKACLGDIVDGPIAPAGASIQINNLGVPVVSAHAALPEMGWFVFVETPVSAALVPALLWSALRIFLVLLTVMAVAVLIALLLVQSGRPDSIAPDRRRAHRRRRSGQPDRCPDRRRTRAARASVQRNGREIAGVVRRSRTHRRGANTRPRPLGRGTAGPQRCRARRQFDA